MTPDNNGRPTITTSVTGPSSPPAVRLRLNSPPAVRLRLNPTLSGWGALDGGWWPRSRDPGAELPGLVTGLDARFGVIIRAMLNMDVWDDHPRRLVAGPRRIHVGWYHTMAADRIYLINTEGERFVLAVVAPEATRESAGTAMAMAAGGRTDGTRPVATLTAQETAA
jgi:Family of unknown function (DUF5994)